MIKNAHHPKYKALVSWLISAREERGLTQRELAKTLDETYSVVAKIETRERKLSVLEYWQYCDALGLAPEEGIRVMRTTEE